MDYRVLLRMGSTNEIVEPHFIDDDYYLDDDDVEYIMSRLLDLQERYFSDIPLDTDMSDKNRFIYNIPRNICNLIMSTDVTAEDDVFSLLFMLYPFLIKDPDRDKQRTYLERISEMIQEESYGDNNIGVDDDE